MTIHKMFVAGNPVPKGNHKAFAFTDRNGKTRTRVTDAAGKSLTSWQNIIAYTASQSIKEPHQGPIALIIQFELNRPGYHFTAMGVPSSKHVRWCVKKPDIDKLIRAVLDGLTGVAYRDDSQVVALIVKKRYASATTGCMLTIQELNEDENIQIQ